MIRCKCGVYTNFGITCSKCALEDWTSKYSFGQEEENIEIVSLDDILEIEESIEDED